MRNETKLTTADVRLASSIDANTLALLHESAWRAGFTDLFDADTMNEAVRRCCSIEKWQGILDGSIDSVSTVFLVVQADIPCGLMQYRPTLEGDVEIERMYVHPDYWGSGASAALMRATFEGLNDKQFRNAVVWSADTPQACGFYEKYGFVATGDTHDLTLFDDVTMRGIRYSKSL